MSDEVIISIPDVHGEGLEAITGILHEHLAGESVDIRSFKTAPSSTDDWITRTQDAHGVILGWKFPDDALAATKDLRAVSFLGTGIADQISLPTCEEKGISTYVVSGYGDNAVAEHTLALLFSAWNSVPQLNASLHAGTWGVVSRTELRGSTLGIIGYGGIGQRVAEIASRIGMRVLVWSRSLKVGDTLPHGTVASFEDVLSQSDAVSVHLALRPETRHFIDASAFARMKPGVVFVNTARADIVDIEALVAALHEGRVRTTGIDVFSTEPAPLDDPLIGIPQAILTPHVGYNSENAVAALMRLGTINLIRHFWPERVK